jgi:hypothetical protein
MTREDGSVYFVPATLQRVHDYVTKKNIEADELMLDKLKNKHQLTPEEAK